MPRTITVVMEVEELALGPVIRKIHEMPGIASFKLDLGEGGLGAGRKQLEEAISTKIRDGGRNNAQLVTQMLMGGPKHIDEIVRAIGGKRSSFYTVTSKLKQAGLVEKAGGGIWQLTTKAKAKLGAIPALPAPSAPPVAHAKDGRAASGSGNIVLRAALDSGPMTRADLRKFMQNKGMSPKSIEGVLFRGRQKGFLKKNGNGYELTAVGRKLPVTMEAAHG